MKRHRWIPAPVDLIRSAERTRWSRESPAPPLVGYLVIRAALDADPGDATTDRSWSAFLGWTRWTARSTLRRVREDLSAWNGQPLMPPKSDQNPPPEVKDPADLESGSDHSPPKTDHDPPTRARDPLPSKKTTTGQDMKTPQLRALWEDVERLRRDALPRSRPLRWTSTLRKGIAARVQEHSAETFLLVWRWVLTSRDKDAAWLRENGYARPGTVHARSKFDSYTARADEWDAAVSGAQDPLPADGGDVLTAWLSAPGGVS